MSIDAATGARCEGFGAGRRSRSHHRRRRDPAQGRLPGDVAACDRAWSGHHRIGGQRQSAHRPAERRGARLRRADRRAALGVGRGGAGDRGRRRGRAGRGAGAAGASDPAAASRQPTRPTRPPAAARASAAAPDRPLDARHRQRVVGDLGRRRARAGLPTDRQRGARLLGRRTERQRLLVGVGGGAPRRHRRGGLALPDRAPRSLGLRRAGAADAGHAPARRRRRSRAGAGDQDGDPVRPRSAHRRVVVPDRGAPGAADRRSRRDHVADAAVPGGAAAADGHHARPRRRVRAARLRRSQVPRDDRSRCAGTACTRRPACAAR